MFGLLRLQNSNPFLVRRQRIKKKGQANDRADKKNKISVIMMV